MYKLGLKSWFELHGNLSVLAWHLHWQTKILDIERVRLKAKTLLCSSYPQHQPSHILYRLLIGGKGVHVSHEKYVMNSILFACGAPSANT